MEQSKTDMSVNNTNFHITIKNKITDEVVRVIPAPSKYARKKIIAKIQHRIDHNIEYIVKL